jgi:ectoine hydroxylase-related dioxygenase (phytanoyl-CoA dioxygenase family)
LQFIPGSHLWGEDRPPSEENVVYAEVRLPFSIFPPPPLLSFLLFLPQLEKGDAFMMLGSCFHGGSANKTEDQERLIFSLFYLRGFLRQEENYFLCCPPEKVAKWPVEMQRAIG